MAKAKGSSSLSSEAYDRLKRDLISGKLAPGTKLVLTNLQVSHGIGAMPLREALNRLSAEQFVVKHEQRGFSMPALDASAFLEIQNARIVIETAALSESIASQSTEWEDRLVLAYHHLAKVRASDSDYLLTEDWSKKHSIFHRALISGCENTWLLKFSDQLFVQSARYQARRRQINANLSSLGDTLLDEHREIMDAAIAGDTATACSCLVEHYRRSVETVLDDPVELCTTHLQFRRQSN